MHRVARCGRVEVRLAPIVVTVVAAVVPAPAAARTVRVLAFNAPPNAAYDARVNGTSRRTIASTQSGTLEYAFDVTAGDEVEFAPADLAPPPAPILSAVVPDAGNCAVATWLPSSDPTVVGYVLYGGPESVASGEATRYQFAVDAGSASGASLCSLPAGVNYVAVRARNYAGVLSAYSAERSVTIGTVAVLITSFDARVRDDGVRLSWVTEADEAVQGYRVYRSEGDEPATPLGEGLLPPDTREFLDDATRSGTSYAYVLGATREDGSEIRSAAVTVTTPALALDLAQNAPNPFNPSTRIPFTLDRAGRAVIRVYDVRGALVTTIFDGQLGEGRHTASWDGRDHRGRPAASGVYIYALTADRRTMSKKMTLLK